MTGPLQRVGLDLPAFNIRDNVTPLYSLASGRRGASTDDNRARRRWEGLFPAYFRTRSGMSHSGRRVSVSCRIVQPSASRTSCTAFTPQCENSSPR